MKTSTKKSKPVEETWAGLCNGQEEEFSALFYDYYPALCRFSLLITNDFKISNQLIIDVFHQLWNQKSDWKNIYHIDSYLYLRAYQLSKECVLKRSH